MRKIFTFLLALAASVGLSWAETTTVTWDSNTISSISLRDGGQSFTKDGVTLTLLTGKISGTRDWRGNSVEASFKFSTSLGNFTRIEITATIRGLEGSGWEQTSPGAVWTGDANEITFGNYFKDVTQIVFTIGDAATAVTGVTLDQNEAQMTVGGETLTLTATVNPNNATDQSVSWSTSDANVATVENGVVTAVAAGNATITVTTTDGSFTATCAVTVTAPEPQGATITVTWNNDDISGSGNSFTKDGVTLTCTDGIDWNWKDFHGPGTFTTDLGNFTKIEVTAEMCSISGDGWSGSTWTGNAASVSFDGAIYGIGEIVFTIEPSGGETAVDNIQIDKAQSTKLIRNGMLLIERNGKLYNATGAEVK